MTKFCIICDKELTGRQELLCSDKKCHREHHTKYNRDWRRSKRKPKFCAVCGKLLTGRQRVICSDNECYREHRRRYYQNNREGMLGDSHKYRRNNAEKIKDYEREYRQNNQEKIKKDHLKWRQNNREHLNKRGRKQYRLSRGLPEDADLHKESSIERITREWLQENSIDFIKQYFISLENSTWTWVDFYIPNVNVCLYCDGGYHHLLPHIKERDENQNRILPQMGYRVIRLTETEILEGNEVWYRLAQYLGIDENEKNNAG